MLLKMQCPRFGIYFGFSFLPCSVPVRAKHMESIQHKQMGRRHVNIDIGANVDVEEDSSTS